MGRRYFVPSSLRGRHRALLRNQVADLILYETLTTTEVRAKALKIEIERFISRAKRGTGRHPLKGLDLPTRRRVLAFLPKEAAVEKFFEQIIPQFRDRVGGYVRVVKLPPRRGDNAPMARVEFVEKIAKVSKAKEEAKMAKSKGKPKDRGKKKDEEDKSNKGKRD